ncbi:MAG: cytochrome-c peroxidase [Pirellulales bacterium]
MHRGRLTAWGLCVLAILAMALTQAGCSKTDETDNKDGKAAKPADEKGALAKASADTAGKPIPDAVVGEGTAKPGQVPLGLPPLKIPADNPMSPEKIELGKLLYFDKRMSADGTLSCATCHDPTKAWAEHEPTSTGIHKQVGQRNSPTIINAAYATSQFWDGRAKSLEEQALGPVENPIEMGHSMEAVVAELAKVPAYQDRFKKVFGTGVTKETFGQAIAAFERTILSGDSPFDRFDHGDPTALTAAQKRGLDLFEGKARCTLCHKPPIFSAFGFFNAGVGADQPKPDVGRMKVTGDEADWGKFRVPALREVANTAPYFHDGSAKKLEEAVDLMAGGGLDNKNLSGMFNGIRAAKLTPADKADLVDFLKALSGAYPVIAPPKLP